MSEVESSRTHFEVLGLGVGLEGQVLGLGLEASSPRKLACPRLEDSTIFWIVKILWSAWKIFWKTFFVEIAWKIFVKTFFFFNVFGDRLKNFCEDLFFLFWRALALVSLVLGLEPCVLDSTSGMCIEIQFFCNTCQPFSIIKDRRCEKFSNVFVSIVFAPNLSAQLIC